MDARELLVDTVWQQSLRYSAAKCQSYTSPDLSDAAKKDLEFEVAREILDWIGSRGRALDIGTATGRYSIELARRGFSVIGIDISRQALAFASSNVAAAGLADKVELLQMDARRLDVSSASLDLVTCMMGTLAHVPQDDQPIVLREIHRALAPGGKLLISSWNPDCLFTEFLSFYDSAERALLLERSPTSRDLCETLTALGFVDLRVTSVGSLPDLSLARRYAEEGLAALRERDRAGAQPGQLYQVVCRRADTTEGSTSGR